MLPVVVVVEFEGMRVPWPDDVGVACPSILGKVSDFLGEYTNHCLLRKEIKH